MDTQKFLGGNQAAKKALAMVIKPEDITEITLMSKGSTNRSYLVRTPQKSYVLRVPDVGADEMVDRYLEKEIYTRIKDCDISDEVLYLDPESGIKISVYYENAAFLDVKSEEDMKVFLQTVKKLHSLQLPCSAEYDFYENIQKYEDLIGGPSRFSAYQKVKNDIFSLKSFTDTHCQNQILIHNDLSCENCLFVEGESGEKKCILIDFEYAARQCPAADIAYFCVFSELDEAETDRLIKNYYEEECTPAKHAEVYAYMALNALLHSNWLEFKLTLEAAHQEDRQKQSATAFALAKLYYEKYKGAIECQELNEQ